MCYVYCYNTTPSTFYIRVYLILFIHDYGYDAYDVIYDAYVNMYYESNIPIY